jgi:hypothetical protein
MPVWAKMTPNIMDITVVRGLSSFCGIVASSPLHKRLVNRITCITCMIQLAATDVHETQKSALVRRF